MRRRPGDRRRVWRQTCNAEGVICLAFAFFCVIGVGGAAGLLIALVWLWLAGSAFQSAQRGWPMSDKRPPWANRHDAIDRKHGVG